MFSVRQKREISEKVQAVLRETNHPELPEGEINFHLHVDGAESWSWADIKNNGQVTAPSVNPFNEMQDKEGEAANIIEDLTNCEALHKNVSREDLIIALKKVVARFNDEHSVKFDPVREVEGYFMYRRIA